MMIDWLSQHDGQTRWLCCGQTDYALMLEHVLLPCVVSREAARVWVMLRRSHHLMTCLSMSLSDPVMTANINTIPAESLHCDAVYAQTMQQGNCEAYAEGSREHGHTSESGCE